MNYFPNTVSTVGVYMVIVGALLACVVCAVSYVNDYFRYRPGWVRVCLVCDFLFSVLFAVAAAGAMVWLIGRSMARV